MPELPEVETFRRYIEEGTLRRRIEKSFLDGIRVIGEEPDVVSALDGRTVIGTRRNGKSLFLGLDDGRWLFIHFGMSGRPLFYRGERPRFTRFSMDFDDESLAICWQRRLGAVGVVSDVDAFLREKGRAEDALDIGEEEFVSAIRGRRTIKSLLLDQSVVSGVGNLYADEILFQTDVDPSRNACDLSGEEKRAMWRAMGKVLRLSIEKGTDFTSFPDGMLLPLRNKDGRCPRCGNPWSKDRVGGRTTYHCRRCQR